MTTHLLCIAEGVVGGQMAISQELASPDLLVQAYHSHAMAARLETEVAYRYRTRFALEPDAVYWQFLDHIKMEP